MAVHGDWCPKCGNPQYVGGICHNDDCNFPAMQSNNEIKRERERTEASRRAQVLADQKRKQDLKIKPPVKPDRSADDFGRILALLGGAATAVYFYRLRPDEPAAYLIPAVISAALLYLFRKLILGLIGLAVILGVIWLIVQNRAGTTPAAVVNEPPGKVVPLPQLSTMAAFGVCLHNETVQDVSYVITWNGKPRALATLKGAHLVADLNFELDDPDAAPNLTIQFGSDGTKYTLTPVWVRATAATKEAYFSQVRCSGESFPKYSFRLVDKRVDLFGPL